MRKVVAVCNTAPPQEMSTIVFERKAANIYARMNDCLRTTRRTECHCAEKTATVAKSSWHIKWTCEKNQIKHCTVPITSFGWVFIFPLHCPSRAARHSALWGHFIFATLDTIVWRLLITKISESLLHRAENIHACYFAAVRPQVFAVFALWSCSKSMQDSQE